VSTGEKIPLVSIELLLDDAAEERVRAEWTALKDAGLSSMGAHTSDSNRPHITLLVRPELSPLDAAPLVACRSFPVILGAPILFGAGDRRVLARRVIPSAALLALHADVARAAGPGDDAPHTRPGEWAPHVTLARRLRVADLGTALSLVGDDIPAQARALRRWDAATSTVTDLGDFRH